MLITQRAVVGGDALTIVRVLAGFHLVDLLHEDLYAVPFAFLNLDNLVEIGLGVEFAGFDFALDELIVRRVNIFIKGGGNLLHLKGREEAVVDAIFERVDVNGVAKVGVGVHVVFALGRGSESELHSGCEIFQDAAPIALVVGTAAMAFVNDDEIEEVRRVLAEIGRGLVGSAILLNGILYGADREIGVPGAAHKGLEDGEEQTGVLRNFAFLANLVRLDALQRVFRKGGEGVVGLISEDVAVGQE